MWIRTIIRFTNPEIITTHFFDSFLPLRKNQSTILLIWNKFCLDSFNFRQFLLNHFNTIIRRAIIQYNQFIYRICLMNNRINSFIQKSSIIVVWHNYTHFFYILCHLRIRKFFINIHFTHIHHLHIILHNNHYSCS